MGPVSPLDSRTATVHRMPMRLATDLVENEWPVEDETRDY